MKTVILVSCLFIAFQTPAPDNDETLQNPVLKPFYSELKTLFRKHYPEVTSHLLNDRIHFEHDTRIFLIHEPLKTGKWQDPMEQRGPKPGGVLCDIELRQGKYMGAAAVPQVLNKHYFSLLLMAPYSGKRDAHMSVHLLYPKIVNESFLKDFTTLVNEFEKLLPAQEAAPGPNRGP